ncbi:MAG TPA: hypothetical protein VET84_00970 [Stellaceae bacterium]|nr:hypothetical protein [Stellaceae bacterium]
MAQLFGSTLSGPTYTLALADRFTIRPGRSFERAADRSGHAPLSCFATVAIVFFVFDLASGASLRRKAPYRALYADFYRYAPI